MCSNYEPEKYCRLVREEGGEEAVANILAKGSLQRYHRHLTIVRYPYHRS